MKQITPYLTFNGNCREAMEFYKNVFGSESLHIMTFRDAEYNFGEKFEPEMQNLVLHSRVQAGEMILYASDCPPNLKANSGDNVTLNVPTDSLEEQKVLFDKLAEGGTITMPLADSFWGSRFGLLTDKFGISWMFDHEVTQKQ